MNKANTLCLISLVLVMYALAQVICFGLNTGNLGGYGPAGLMMAMPVVGYALGRLWTSKEPKD